MVTMDPIRRSLLEEFQEDEKVRFLAILLRMARADGVSALERNRLQPIAEWVGVGPDEQAEAVRRADDESLTLEELVSGFQHGADKGLLLYRESCGVVWVDLTKTPDEEKLLSELARVLGISDEMREVLDSPLSASPEGERRFLTLLGGTYSAQTEG
jgi:uncharacterized membrane protein YebE (DUF533 family)